MLRARWDSDRSKHVAALAELQQALALSEPPNRIECYDISNLQGTAVAGSMVVFEQGAPSKKLYRKFTIKSVHGQDDFASMEEVLDRRFRRWALAREARKPGGKLDAGLRPAARSADRRWRQGPARAGDAGPGRHGLAETGASGRAWPKIMRSSTCRAGRTHSCSSAVRRGCT